MSRISLLAGACAFAAGLYAFDAAAQVAPSAAATPAVSTPLEALTKGAPLLEIRPRYEDVDQTRTKVLTDSAQAYTVRIHAGWQTATWHDLQALVEVTNVSAFGPERYAVNVPGATTPPLNGADKARYPVVNDPTTTELGRAQITWTPGPAFTTTLGRQRIAIDDQRFVGDSDWRQDRQTFDGARADAQLGALHLFAAYLDRINRTLAQDRDFTSNSYLFNARYAVSKTLALEAFDYLLDFRNAAINSSQTWGARASGQSQAGPLKLAYNATYARQTPYANAPGSFGLDFYAADVSAAYGIATVRLDYEQLDGDGRRGFTTPIATTHGYQGWADAFAAPGGNKSFVDGIQDYNVTLTLRPSGVWGPFSKPQVLVRAYDFKDQRFGSSLGHEWDLSASVNLAEKVSLLLKYADFKREQSAPAGAAAPPASRTKVWLMLDFKL